MPRSLHIDACALLALTLCGCTESFKPDVSTETGNPPTIDIDKVALVVTSDEVHVQGEPGAVTPPEGTVEVTILRNQHVVTGPVEGDGSFDVEVDATLDDVFEVRAVLDGQRSNAVIVMRGGAQVGQGDGGTLGCDQRSNIAYQTMQAAIAEGDRRCETDDDCILASPDSSCYKGCGFEYLSADGIASLDEVRQSLDEGLCESYYDDGCTQVFEPPCLPPEPALCFFGECHPGGGGGQIVDGGTGSGLCDLEGDIEWCAADISWRITGPGTLPALPSNESYALTNCNTLTRSTGEGTCETQAPRCTDDAPADGAALEGIYTLLRNPDVRAAFNDGGTYGEPAETSGFVYEVTVNGQTVTYNSCTTSSNDACATSPLERLIVELSVLTQEATCEIDADCASDFEAGECDAAIPVYWHDPKTGLCSPATYGGCGGNGNRYESVAACEAACPPPDSSSCPPNRVYVEDVCVECGLTGGCVDQAAACLLVCTETVDCAGEKAPDGTSLSCQDGKCWAPLLCL